MSKLSLQIVSDLHIEKLYPSIPDWKTIIKKKSNILILAGDIGRLELYDQYTQFMEEICQGFINVFLVPGNHEFYSNTHSIEFLSCKLQDLAYKINNLTVVSNTSINLTENIRLYGCTLWSHIPETNRVKSLPIKTIDGRLVGPSWLNYRYFEDVYGIETEILRSENDKKRLIIVTHYAPTFLNTLDPKHFSHPKRFYYANNLDRLLYKDQVYIWIFGHTHINCDYRTLGYTRVVSNQYAGKGYNKEKVLYISDKQKNEEIKSL
jgi:Icc-related predicted phosphoesterase